MYVANPVPTTNKKNHAENLESAVCQLRTSVDLFNWFMNFLPNKYLVSILGIAVIIIVLIFGLRVSFKKIKQKLPF